MASTDYLKSLLGQISASIDEAHVVARELVRDDVLKPQTLTDFAQIKHYVMWAQHNIDQAELAEAKARRASAGQDGPFVTTKTVPGVVVADSKGDAP